MKEHNKQQREPIDFEKAKEWIYETFPIFLNDGNKFFFQASSKHEYKFYVIQVSDYFTIYLLKNISRQEILENPNSKEFKQNLVISSPVFNHSCKDFVSTVFRATVNNPQ